MPEIFHMPHYFSEFLKPITNGGITLESSHSFEYVLIGVSILALLIIIFATKNYYISKATMPEEEKELTGFSKLVYNKYYVDEIYVACITKPLDAISLFFYKVVEIGVIDKIVNGVGVALNLLSSHLRKLQAGNVGYYVFGMVIGIIFLLLLTMIV